VGINNRARRSKKINNNNNRQQQATAGNRWTTHACLDARTVGEGMRSLKAPARPQKHDRRLRRPTNRPTNFSSMLLHLRKREKRANFPSCTGTTKLQTTLLPPGMDPNLLFHHYHYHHHHFSLSLSLKGRRKIFHFDVHTRGEGGRGDDVALTSWWW